MSRWIKVLITGLLPMVSILSVLFAGEAALRLYQWLRLRAHPFETIETVIGRLSPVTMDEHLGWRATENYHFVGFEKTAGGAAHRISMAQNEYGFRMFGELHTTKPKILVIGDSFTQAVDVSDDEPYYAILKNYVDAEVFAYGVGGYGTLQEYLILNKYFDLIKPDLIIWQYCINDFINNSPELELASTINNHAMRRPYWVDGEIIYMLPKESSARIRQFALKHSRFLYVLISRWDKLQASKPAHTVETDIAQQGFEHRGFLHSVDTTDAIMGKVRNRVGSVPIVAFSESIHAPYGDALKVISSRYEITFLADVALTLQVALEKGDDINADDKVHWNQEGHRLTARALARHLEAMTMLKNFWHAGQEKI